MQSIYPFLEPGEVGVIGDVDAWEALRPEWEALQRRGTGFQPVGPGGRGFQPVGGSLEGCPTKGDRLEACPTACAAPLHYDWMRTWWEVYGPTYGRGLRIVTFRSDGRLMGVLPLYESHPANAVGRVRRLGFLSTGEAEWEETCAEYLDLLAAPGWQQACAGRFWALLDEGGLGTWDELELANMPHDSAIIRLAPQRALIKPCGVCPMADLSGGMDAYFARLSSRTRQHLRRLVRVAQRSGARFEMAGDRQQAAEFFAQLIELHQQRWRAAGKPGAFSAPRFVEFHRRLTERWVPGNQAGQAVLARLAVDGRAVAVAYGFVADGKYDSYQTGFASDEEHVRSPGIVLFLSLMGHLHEQRGVECFDFLRGLVPYKQQLATDQRPLLAVRLRRTSVAASAYRLGELFRRASRRGARLVQALNSGKNDGR